ncbi:zinc finger MYM-type protein 5-like [Hydra vulgaris]|uniref:Zinc finger MYM-type protein 5-like n=1 Tax=Hydra vulgaris TaxID=6087 RepID=A0ABM4DHC5_HYDVU
MLPFCTWEEISDWPQTLTNHNIQEIVINGPVNRQLNSYPRNYDNRSFSLSFFCRKISNGESHPRSWLIYSEKVNKIFCFCCKLFNITDTSLARTGSADWRHLSQNLTRHKVSVDHIENFGNRIELKRRLQSSKTVDCSTEKQLLNEIDRWNNALKRKFP